MISWVVSAAFVHFAFVDSVDLESFAAFEDLAVAALFSN